MRLVLRFVHTWWVALRCSAARTATQRVRCEHSQLIRCLIKPRPHQQQCRSNVRLCCQIRQQCRTSFAWKFRPFDKVERCFDIVAGVDGALVRHCRKATWYFRCERTLKRPIMSMSGRPNYVHARFTENVRDFKRDFWNNFDLNTQYIAGDADFAAGTATWRTRRNVHMP